jgi:DNA-binding transcriptional LysR family regulator
MDLELLRTFVAILQSGSFAKAAARRHITQSTVSQQMRRLADQAGHPLFSTEGRRRVPTPSAELLLGYAQRLLALHDEAARALDDGDAPDVVRLGTTQDFAEVRLPAVLRTFRQSHPRVRLEVRVGASQELARLVEARSLDAAVVFAGTGDKVTQPLARERACWLAGRGFVAPAGGRPWPLALFDAPCAFRAAAIQALDAARIPWQIVYATPSLSGLLAAVRAGFAVTLRLARHSQKGLRALGTRDGLPAVARFPVALLTADTPTPATRALCAALTAG